MDASFATTTLAMLRAIRLMERGLADPEQIISHRCPLSRIHEAPAVMGSLDHSKIIVNP
jgi:threonine dehydrogenase-like Zn-dependent dehydrogenase